MHIYRLHWLLPDWEWTLGNAEHRVEIRLKSPHGEFSLTIQADSGTSHAALRTSLVRAGEVVSGVGTPDPLRGWVSPTYAHKLPALSLAIEVESAGSVTLTSEFIFPAIEDGC
jgi:hypothetical protein